MSFIVAIVGASMAAGLGVCVLDLLGVDLL